MKKEDIKNKLIELIDTNDNEIIKDIDIFINEPYIECDLDLVFDIVYSCEDTFKKLINSYEFRNDEHKLYTTIGVILHTMRRCLE